MTSGRPQAHLVQICNAFGNAVYVPLAAGLVRAYARSRPELASHYDFAPIVNERFDLARTAELFPLPAVVGISVYVWNWQFSLALARELKRLHPDVFIVLGGPQVPEDSGPLLETGVVDATVHGEGELAFADVLDALRTGRPVHEVPGVTARDATGIHRGPTRQRIEDLDALPSPFLGGDFDHLIGNGRQLIGLWETNRGCPFRCTFCYWGSAINQRVRMFGWERLCGELEWFSRNRVDYLLSADANFGIKKRDIELAQRVADTKKRTGFPRKFRVFSTKNASDRVLDIMEVLRSQDLDQGMSLTFQTLSPKASEAIQRDNIRLDSFVTLSRESRRRGLVTYTDLIVGLPGESYDSFLDGLDTLMRLGQHDNVHVYHCTVLVGSEMADPAYREKHGLLTVTTPILERHMRADAIRDGDVQEFEEIVVGSNTMPFEDWVRTNVATSIVNVLHYQKLLHQVAIHLHAAHATGYRRLYEHLVRAPLEQPERFPITSSVWRFAESYFRSMGSGRGPRLVFPEYGDIVWPIEEALFLLLAKDFTGVYAELRALLDGFLEEMELPEPRDRLDDLFRFQQLQTPRPGGPLQVEAELEYAWPEYFGGLGLTSDESTDWKPESGVARYRVTDHHRTGGDLVRFAREVVWYARSASNLPYRLTRLEAESSPAAGNPSPAANG